MRLGSYCAPSLLYVAFSTIQIIVDIFKHEYQIAFVKLFATGIIATVLNMLCKRGLGLLSWLIVFLPFIMMTIISALLLFVFRLKPTHNHNKDKNNNLF